ncbi:MAG: ribonuclease P protein component [Bacteroidetes bacterium]|nr:ribonuclease P protein component [Bacteroidota bacterium]
MQNWRYTFCKDERLKSRKVIQELFEKGKIVHHYPFKVLYIYKPKNESKFPAQFAISVSKKNFKHAVDRNRIKRKAREAYRKNKHTLYSAIEMSDQMLCLFVIYTAKDEVEYTVFETEMKNMIRKIKQKYLNDSKNS